MKELTSAMDADGTLFLSVSAYECIDLSKFVTYSHRALLLQPLSPIFPVGLDQFKLETLPPLLQVFPIENRRKELPCNDDYLKSHAKLSWLLFEAGVHPRRTQYLM